MKRILFVGVCRLFALMALLNIPMSGYGVRAADQAPTPTGLRLARSDATIVGTVTAIEEKTVTATKFPGDPDKVEYHVATVKVEQALQGAKGLTHIKVAFFVPAKPVPPPDSKTKPVRPGRGQSGRVPPTLTKGQEALLFLKQHHAENFYIMGTFDDLLDRTAPDYKADLERAKKAVGTIAEPLKALKADGTDDRFTAASILLVRYRTVPLGIDRNTLKQEEISGEESKLILAALAEANWPRKLQGGLTNPLFCFVALGLTEKDGWRFTGSNFQNMQEQAQKWLKDNAHTYRVRKFVAAEK